MTTTAAASHRTTHLSFIHVLRSEWIKFWTLRSTIWTLSVTVFVTIGFSLLAAWGFTQALNPDNQPAGPGGGAPGLPTDPIVLALSAATAGITLVQLAVAVLGVLIISGEYSTGMIRSTLVAVPRRLPMMFAKALVLAVVTFVVGVIIFTVSYFASAPILSTVDITTTFTDPEIYLHLLGAALYLTLIALIAFGVGLIIRSSAGGIAIVIGILLVLPILLAIVPVDWIQDLGKYLPSSAGATLSAPSMDPAAFEPWQGVLVVLGWVAVTLGLGGWLLKRRDA